VGSHRRRRRPQPLTSCDRRLIANGFTEREARILTRVNPRHVRWLRQAGYSWAQARQAVYNPAGDLIVVSNGRTTKSYSLLELLSAHSLHQRKR
jgi:hypothetical protein